MSKYTAGRLVEIVQRRKKGVLSRLGKAKESIYLYCKDQDVESAIRKAISQSVLANDGTEGVAGVLTARIFNNLKGCEFISCVHAPEPEPGSDVFVVDVPGRRVGVWSYSVRDRDDIQNLDPNPGSWVSFNKLLNY